MSLKYEPSSEALHISAWTGRAHNLRYEEGRVVQRELQAPHPLLVEPFKCQLRMRFLNASAKVADSWHTS